MPTDGWLLRDFLREALYNRDDGYFANASSPPVGAMSRPIPFQALLGQEDYARTLARYDALASQWLTPVEIFKPHYARAVEAHPESTNELDGRRRRRTTTTAGREDAAAGYTSSGRDRDVRGLLAHYATTTRPCSTSTSGWR